MNHLFFLVLVVGWTYMVLSTPAITKSRNTLNENLSILPPALLNATSSHLTSPGTALDMVCNGAEFGFSPSISDCQSAYKHLAPDTDQYQWGMRHTHTGMKGPIFPLPYRIMGGAFPISREIDVVTKSLQQTGAYASSKPSSSATRRLSRVQAYPKYAEPPAV